MNGEEEYRADTRPALAPHLLMESKGPWTGPSCAAFLRDARDLARIGHPVQLLLIQDGVGAAVRDPSASAGTREVAEAGGEIWVDDFSLAQRGLSDSDLLPSARVVGMSEVSARVLDHAVKVVWH